MRKSSCQRQRTTAIAYFLFVFSVFGEESKMEIDVEMHGIASPIVYSPNSMMSEVVRKLFVEENYEIGIFPSVGYSDEHLFGIVIRRKSDGFECLVKRISLRDVYTNHSISLELLAEADLVVRSSKIDSTSVKVLADLLREKIVDSSYHSKITRNRYRSLDGVKFDVYVRGTSNDAYDEYSARVIDGIPRSSYSCSTVVHCLVDLVLSKRVLDEGVSPLEKLVEFLKTDDNETVDPFLKVADPIPEIEPPLVR